MISGGNATIIVRSMDDSIRFSTDVLGLKLTNPFGSDWATISAGDGLTIGIHPASPKYPDAGTRGSIILGFDLDVPAEQAVAQLVRHGVVMKDGVVRSDAGNFVQIDDLDGNQMYLWEQAPDMLPATDVPMATASAG